MNRIGPRIESQDGPASRTAKAVNVIATSIANLNVDDMDNVVAALLNFAHKTLIACSQQIAKFTHIHRLPNEILTMIFKTVIDATYDDLAYPMTSPATVLSHVCATWRHVAVSNPFLWTKITRSKTWNMDAIETYLRRSNPHPFDIHLFTPIKYNLEKKKLNMDTKLCEDMEELGRMLKRYLTRCRSLVIRVDEFYEFEIQCIVDAMKSELSQPLPLLQELHLEILHPDEELIHQFYDDREPEECDFTGIGDISALTTLKVGVPVCLWHIETLKNSNITCLHLALDLIPVSLFRDFISSFKALETLVVYGLFQDGIPPQETPPEEIDSLRSFAILGAPLFVFFLRLISFARLHHLIVAPYGFLESIFESSGEAGCHESVQELTLGLNNEKTRMVAEHSDSLLKVRALSRCFPNVQMITVVGKYRYVFLNTLMMLDKEGQLLWPRLHTLAVRSADDFDIVRQLADFRAGAGSPLSRVYMANTPSFEFETLGGTVEVIDRDLWRPFARTAMYYPHHCFADSCSEGRSEER